MLERDSCNLSLLSFACSWPPRNLSHRCVGVVACGNCVVHLCHILPGALPPAQIARSTGAPSVIIHDRALLDISAYLPADLWSALLEREGLTSKGVLARYDGVVHMVTAADGAEEFYTLSTNTARTETAEQARALDKAVLDAWGSHPVHCKAENPAEGGFDAKAATVVAAVLDQVGNAR